MRIAWLTDIHLDHAGPDVTDSLSRDVAETAPDGVVVTGDISVAPRLAEDLERFLAAFEAPVYFVAGNHDYWGASVAKMRPALERMVSVQPRLRWLPAEDPILLDADNALVGVDGWADARFGDLEGSPVRLRDYTNITELATGELASGVAAARAIADADADRLRTLLERALTLRAHVYVATHLPPFAEAARFAGHVTHPHWLPWVTSKAIGDALLEAAARHPTRRITVLCGHMHHPAREQIRENLEVRTGPATYGEPRVGDVLVLER